MTKDESDLDAIVRDAYRQRDLEAAAPELLQLAERVAEHFKYTDAPLGETARELIARIRGEQEPQDQPPLMAQLLTSLHQNDTGE